jgi:preprotein translocase subunit YajC
VSGWESILPFVLIVVVFWFLVVRPARNQQKRLAATQSSATIGTEVMLGSGIYGTVVGVGDDTFDIQVSPGTTIKVAKQAVVRVIEPTAGPDNFGTTGNTGISGDDLTGRADDDTPSSDQDR